MVVSCHYYAPSHFYKYKAKDTMPWGRKRGEITRIASHTYRFPIEAPQNLKIFTRFQETFPSTRQIQHTLPLFGNMFDLKLAKYAVYFKSILIITCMLLLMFVIVSMYYIQA